jgi:hypothetical protein
MISYLRKLGSYFLVAISADNLCEQATSVEGLKRTLQTDYILKVILYITKEVSMRKLLSSPLTTDSILCGITDPWTGHMC